MLDIVNARWFEKVVLCAWSQLAGSAFVNCEVKKVSFDIFKEKIEFNIDRISLCIYALRHKVFTDHPKLCAELESRFRILQRSSDSSPAKFGVGISKL